MDDLEQVGLTLLLGGESKLGQNLLTEQPSGTGSGDVFGIGTMECLLSYSHLENL